VSCHSNNNTCRQ